MWHFVDSVVYPLPSSETGKHPAVLLCTGIGHPSGDVSVAASLSSSYSHDCMVKREIQSAFDCDNLGTRFNIDCLGIGWYCRPMAESPRA